VAKKTSKSSKKKATKKKSVSKKSASKTTTKKKSSSKKKPVSREKIVKKAANKTTPKKKTVKKKVVKKKATTKKSAKKKVATKKPAKKPTKKASTKKSGKKAGKKKSTVTRTPGGSKQAARSGIHASHRPSEDAPRRPIGNYTSGKYKPWDSPDAPTLEQLKKVKTGLKKKDLEYFRQLLLERRLEIIGDVRGLEAHRGGSAGDLSHMPLHMADVGSDNYEQEFTLGLMQAERQIIIEIDEALQRLDDGYYGVCLESANVIGRARLEAQPWAKYCIEVAREREQRGGR
jgi:RNA polymerase-binding protein DksA